MRRGGGASQRARTKIAGKAQSAEAKSDTGVFQDAIRRVPRLDLSVDDKRAFGDRASPDFMIAFASSRERTARLAQQVAYGLGVFVHSGA
jgi:hypothetical protein